MPDPHRAALAGVLALALALITATPAVASGDRDNDGVPDAWDNCPSVKNAGQADWDGDGIGDACDDSDGDRLSDEYEMQRSHTSPTERDTDDDGLGDGDEVRSTGTDPLDPDTDDDGVLDGQDNCPTRPNREQHDVNGDGHGDFCTLPLDEPAVDVPDPGEPPPVPVPGLGPAGLVADLTVLADDGLAMTGVQTGTRDFTVRFRDVTTGQVQELGLRSDLRYIGGPVKVLLYTATSATPVSVEVLWRYYPLSRSLSFGLRGPLPAAALGLRMEAPLAREVCETRCTLLGAGFLNPAQSVAPRDEGDAVLTPLALS